MPKPGLVEGDNSHRGSRRGGEGGGHCSHNPTMPWWGGGSSSCEERRRQGQQVRGEDGMWVVQPSGEATTGGSVG